MKLSSLLRISRPFAFVLLLSLFLLCFILTPLWNSQPGYMLKGLVLITTIILGFGWAWWSSGEFRFISLRQLLWFFMCFLLFLIMEFRNLTASIPWRGDEDYHIFCALQIAKSLFFHKLYFLILFLFLIFAWYRKSMDGKLVLGAFVFITFAAWGGQRAHIDIYHALRYPIFLNYLTALPVYVAAFFPTSPYPELPFRLFPLLSAIGLCGICFYSLQGHSLLLRVGVAMAVATLPIVRNYDSLFYLEMPAVFCMALVCSRALQLLRSEPKQISQLPSWYALLLLGFIKETTLPFLFAFLCCRLITRAESLFQKGNICWKTGLDELRIIFSVCFPIILYLFYRAHLGTTRSYSPHLNYLLDPSLYWIELQSLWDSFGLLLPFSIVGAIRLGSRRNWNLLLFLGLAFLLDLVFHFLDDQQYSGYSRFNLFLLPSLLAFGLEGLRMFSGFKRAYVLAGLVVIVGTNICQSPVNTDGTRKTGWGVYGTDIGDQTYPYREALTYFQKHHSHQKVLLTGHYYPYYTAFYTKEKDWPEQKYMEATRNEGARIDSTLKELHDQGYQAVLYHLLADIPIIKNKHGYEKTMVFKNQTHSLILFSL